MRGKNVLPLKLHIVVCSTRPGRVGLSVAKWFEGVTVQHAKFACELVDLAEFNLPVYNEPNHPRFQKYQHDHTKKWSACVSAADAFVFVTPEYNYGPPPSLLNALDYVYVEWNYKPASFVSYGGMSGEGSRRTDRETYPHDAKNGAYRGSSRHPDGAQTTERSRPVHCQRRSDQRRKRHARRAFPVGRGAKTSPPGTPPTAVKFRRALARGRYRQGPGIPHSQSVSPPR